MEAFADTRIAKVEFPQYEIFFPQNDESEEFQKVRETLHLLHPS
jgi:hypothetical protein